MDTDSQKLGPPRVSVIMPAYNRAGTILAAIESVRSQTFTNWECIVVDDGSTDTTKETLSQITDGRIRYIRHEENAGVIARRNEAVAETRGEYIAVLDSDDRWVDPGKLEKQVSFMEAHSEHVLLGTQAILTEGASRVETEYPSSDEAIRDGLLAKNLFIHSSCLMRKSALPREPYRPEHYLVEDYGLWLSLGCTGKIANLPEAAIEYAVHSGSQMAQNRLEATKRSLELVREYRGAYPHYWRSVLMWKLKIVLRIIRG